jgi:peptide/nickel transport system substrate-binding protein
MRKFKNLTTLLLTAFIMLGSISVFAQTEIPREHTLIIGFEGGPSIGAEVMNPYIPAGHNTARGMHQTMMEHLFYLNYETGEIVPWLATGYVISADATEITITLRDGVKWSDGEPFTASDVAFTLNMLKNHPTLRGAGAYVNSLDTATAVDDLTAVIKLTAPNPRFILLNMVNRIFGGTVIVPEHIWSQITDYETFTYNDPEKGWPVFTGPYKYVRSNENEFVYDRDPNWWAAQTGFHALPAPERVIFIEQGPEDRRAAMLQANEIDGVPALSRGAFEAVKAVNPNIIGWSEESPYAYIDPCPVKIQFNTTIAPWDDSDIRHAVSLSVDRGMVANLVYEGTGLPAQFLWAAYPALNAYLEGVSDLLQPFPGNDLAAAATILEGKGYTRNADNMWVDANGQPIVIRLSHVASSDNTLLVQSLMQAFGDGGFTVEPKPLSESAWREDISLGTAEVYNLWSCGSVVDPFATLNNYHSRYVVPNGERGDLDRNPARWSNAEYDQLVDAIGLLQPGDPAIEPLFRSAVEILDRETPSFPLYHQVRINPHNKTYWTNWPTADNNYIQPQNWWAQTLLFIIELQPAQ